MSSSPDQARPNDGSFCGLCGYQVGEVARCESCGAFRLGRDWHGPDRLRVLTSTSPARVAEHPGHEHPGDEAEPSDAEDRAGRQP